jgi:hypothetical protein
MTQASDADASYLGLWGEETAVRVAMPISDQRWLCRLRLAVRLATSPAVFPLRLIWNGDQARAGESLKAERSRRYFLSSLPSRLRSLPHRRAAWLTLPLVSFSNAVM